MSELTPELIETVLAGIAEGVPLRQLARLHGFGKSTWYDRLEADSDLAGRFAHARARGFDAIAEETLDIADDASNDWMEREGKEGASPGWALNGEHVQRSKLRIETRLKLLAKWDPKRYGELVKLAGPDGEGPISVAQITADMTPEKATELYTKLMG